MQATASGAVSPATTWHLGCILPKSASNNRADRDKRPIFLVSNVYARPKGAATSHRWTTMGGNAEIEVATIAEIASAAAAVREA